MLRAPLWAEPPLVVDALAELFAVWKHWWSKQVKETEVRKEKHSRTMNLLAYHYRVCDDRNYSSCNHFGLQKSFDTISHSIFLDKISSTQLNNHDRIFINDLDARLKGIINKFAYDTKLGIAVDSLKGKEALQRRLSKLEVGNHQLYEF